MVLWHQWAWFQARYVGDIIFTSLIQFRENKKAKKLKKKNDADVCTCGFTNVMDVLFLVCINWSTLTFWSNDMSYKTMIESVWHSSILRATQFLYSDIENPCTSITICFTFLHGLKFWESPESTYIVFYIKVYRE